MFRAILWILRTGARWKPLAAIREVDAELWKIIQSILTELDPPGGRGGRQIDRRAALNSIIYQIRSGCQWNHLPKQFGDGPSVQRTFQRWINKGVLEQIWAMLVENSREPGGVDWQWQWQNADGGLLGAVMADGNVRDTKLMKQTIRRS